MDVAFGEKICPPFRPCFWAGVPFLSNALVILSTLTNNAVIPSTLGDSTAVLIVGAAVPTIRLPNSSGGWGNYRSTLVYIL